MSLNRVVKQIIDLRNKGEAKITLLAVCPNSEAVLEAAVKAAVANRSVMLFAATLNQVDLDGGYTGWTPRDFVARMQRYAQKYHWDGLMYPCLDHGGPWLKDKDTLSKLSYAETMANVRRSIEACIQAGYALLHIDPTIDRDLEKRGNAIAVETVVERTVELIKYAEEVRQREGKGEIAYEVGTEEVHGGMVDLQNFARFITLLKERMAQAHLSHVWPCFFVAQVGTDLHTTRFDSNAARQLYELLYPLGSLAKGHYTDWVANPEEYPETGMGGANVGPEFTAEEFNALKDLTEKEALLCKQRRGMKKSGLMEVIQKAVVDSGRWKKWLQEGEYDLEFWRLSPARRLWLLQTGSRYVWASAEVVKARQNLYNNLQTIMADPNQYVVDRLVRLIDRYIVRFNLFNSQERFS